MSSCFHGLTVCFYHLDVGRPGCRCSKSDSGACCSPASNPGSKQVDIDRVCAVAGHAKQHGSFNASSADSAEEHQCGHRFFAEDRHSQQTRQCYNSNKGMHLQAIRRHRVPQQDAVKHARLCSETHTLIVKTGRQSYLWPCSKALQACQPGQFCGPVFPPVQT